MNVRLISLALAAVLALGVNSNLPADDDTWHNVYHSLKRFFTGSKSSPTPSPHHRVKHSDGGERGAGASTVANANPSSAASPTPRVVVLPAATPAVVVLPSATPVRETAASPSKAVAATPTPGAHPAGQPDAGAAKSTSKSRSAGESGPVLRSLSGPGAGANPSAPPSATP
jgi:hypothetical protein